MEIKVQVQNLSAIIQEKQGEIRKATTKDERLCTEIYELNETLLQQTENMKSAQRIWDRTLLDMLSEISRAEEAIVTKGRELKLGEAVEWCLSEFAVGRELEALFEKEVSVKQYHIISEKEKEIAEEYRMRTVVLVGELEGLENVIESSPEGAAGLEVLVKRKQDLSDAIERTKKDYEKCNAELGQWKSKCYEKAFTCKTESPQVHDTEVLDGIVVALRVAAGQQGPVSEQELKSLEELLRVFAEAVVRQKALCIVYLH